MGIHYDYKSTRGAKAMEKQAKREKKLAEKRAKKIAKQGEPKIPEDKTKLFFDFCSARGISSELLKDKNKMMLIEELVTNSQLFLILLEQYGGEATVKD